MHPHHRAAGRGRVSTGPHARWFRARLAGAGIIDMGAGEHASRVWRSRRVHRARATALAAGAVLALGCATAGVVLSILPTGVSVAMTATTYRIGDATLHAVAPGVYSGSGTLVLGHSGPDLTAGGSAVVDGARWVAVLRGRRGRGGGDVPPAERDADADRTRRVVRRHVAAHLQRRCARRDRRRAGRAGSVPGGALSTPRHTHACSRCDAASAATHDRRMAEESVSGV